MAYLALSNICMYSVMSIVKAEETIDWLCQYLTFAIDSYFKLMLRSQLGSYLQVETGTVDWSGATTLQARKLDATFE